MYNMSKTSIAIITARIGSKRIPKKNIREFCGKPILIYSIEAALHAEIFDEVMVSTDSEEIAEIAEKAGAKVPFLRSEKTSGDFATTADVILEVLEHYKETGREFERIFCIYPTAPFVTAEKLKKAMELLEKKKAKKVMPIVAYSSPPQRAYILEENYIRMREPENANRRSQDLEPMYYDPGQFYGYDTESFLRLKGQIWEDVVPLIVPESEVQDIDKEEDWKLAELKYQAMNISKIENKQKQNSIKKY